MFNILDIGAAGLTAQRVRMDTIAGNVLNAETTRNEAGERVPYRRRFVVLEPGRANDPRGPGVHVAKVGLDSSPFQKRYEPGHVDADAEGYVLYPNVHLPMEFANMLEASRAYEASITMMETTKAMLNSSLRLLA
jgi:flagellar basal-body rod protein FlgC